MNMTSEYAETGIRTRVKGLGSPCDNHYTIPASNGDIAHGYKRNLVVQYNGQKCLREDCNYFYYESNDPGKTEHDRKQSSEV